MRLIGHLPAEPAARTFGDYLFVRGIENNIEPDAPAGWGVWIHDEDRMAEAAALLKEFRAAPDSPEYRKRAAEAEAKRRAEEKSEEAYRRRFHTSQEVFPTLSYGIGRVTLTLILLSVVFFLLTYERGMVWYWMASGLRELFQGQVWRLVTPIFLHGGVLHILFNMLWLKDFGSMIEARKGSSYLAILVLLIASGSNAGQYVAQFLTGGAGFAGMSGVNYGLFGYIWMRSRFDPGAGFFIHPSTVTLLLVWAVICLVGIIPNVANTAHFVGLGIGVVWGFVASRRWR